MRGSILSVSATSNQGVILGDDGIRYTFVRESWGDHSEKAVIGMKVDFESSGDYATSVHPIPGAASPTAANVNPPASYYHSGSSVSPESSSLMPSVQGTILSAAASSNQGLILGDDGVRYTFTFLGWRDQSVKAIAGMKVNFEVRGSSATGVYPVPGAPISPSPMPTAQFHPPSAPSGSQSSVGQPSAAAPPVSPPTASPPPPPVSPPAASAPPGETGPAPQNPYTPHGAPFAQNQFNINVPGAQASGYPMIRKSKMVAALFAIFLGWIGIHKFYLGKTGMGIFYIIVSCTVVGFFFIAFVSFIEGVIYLFKSDDDVTQMYQKAKFGYVPNP